MDYAFRKPLHKLIVPIFDILGTILFLPSRFFKKSIPPDPKNILIVRLDHIGDFVSTTPLFRNIKAHFPGARITALVNSASKDLAFRDPRIDKVISFSPFYLARNESSSLLKGLRRVVKDIRAIGFDLGMDPRGDLLSILLMWLGGIKYRIGYGITGGGFFLSKMCKYDDSRHAIDRNMAILESLNIPVVYRSPEVYFDEKDKKIVESLIRELSITLEKSVVMHPFAGTEAKRWMRDNFQKLIEYFISKDRNVLIVGSKDDSGTFAGATDMRGRMNLPQLAYLIKKTGFFIGLDSGPANIAAASGAKTIVICSGTNTPELWLPKMENVRLIYNEVVCRPCGLKICPKEKHICMDTVRTEDVIKVMERSWQA